MNRARIRKAFLMHVQPGKIRAYEESHNPIWPELLRVLKEHGVQSYSIFHDSETDLMFGYVEIEDEASFEALAELPVCREWWLYMKRFLVSDATDSPKAMERPLREVFRLDGNA